jgi:uncharacterized membrane protein
MIYIDFSLDQALIFQWSNIASKSCESVVPSSDRCEIRKNSHSSPFDTGYVSIDSSSRMGNPKIVLYAVDPTRYIRLNMSRYCFIAERNISSIAVEWTNFMSPNCWTYHECVPNLMVYLSEIWFFNFASFKVVVLSIRTIKNIYLKHLLKMVETNISYTSMRLEITSKPIQNLDLIAWFTQTHQQGTKTDLYELIYNTELWTTGLSSTTGEALKPQIPFPSELLRTLWLCIMTMVRQELLDICV